MIAIFMTFVTYGQNKRNNFLKNDITISQEFQAGVRIKPQLWIYDADEEERENCAINDELMEDLLRTST